MKVLLLALLLCTMAAAVAAPSKVPYIVSQKTEMVTHEATSLTWERWITIKNPLNRAVWVFIECEHHLTVNPIGISGRRKSTITLPDVPPQDGCVLHHWQKMGNETTAPEWRP